MNTKPTLESVVSDFKQWRQNKSHPRSRIPEVLKQKAVTLLMDMSQGKITKALGISSAMLKSWSVENTQNNNPTDTIEFIPRPLSVLFGQKISATTSLTQREYKLLLIGCGSYCAYDCL